MVCLHFLVSLSAFLSFKWSESCLLEVPVIPPRVLGLPQSIEIARGQTRNSGKAYGDPCCSRVEREQSTGFLAPLCPERGWAGSLYGVRVEVCPGVRLEGWLRWSAHPFGGVVCREHAQYPAFAPDTLLFLPVLQKWQLGFLVFSYLFVYNSPQLSMHAVTFSPL